MGSSLQLKKNLCQKKTVNLRSTFILDLDVASVRIYKTTKGKTSDESSEARKARMRAVRAHKK